MAFEIPSDLASRLKEALISLISNPSQPALVVTDKDGNDLSDIFGGLSGLGGGLSIWSNVSGDFTATPNASTKTITLSSYSSTILSSILTSVFLGNGLIKKRDSSGIITTLPITNILISTNVITLSDMTSNFASGDTVAVFIPGPVKGYEKTTDLLKTTKGSTDAGEQVYLGVQGVQKIPVASPLFSATPAMELYTSVAIASTARSTQLFGIAINNKNASERFLWLKNKATTIANPDTVTADADIVIPLPASTNELITFGEDFFGTGGINFPLGLTIGVSTDKATFTAATAADHAIVYFKL